MTRLVRRSYRCMQLISCCVGTPHTGLALNLQKDVRSFSSEIFKVIILSIYKSHSICFSYLKYIVGVQRSFTIAQNRV